MKATAFDSLISTLVEEKRTGIGGSDIGDVLSLPPWGCRRRLWYQKNGIKPDYETELNPILERGIALEGVALELYQRNTGRTTDLGIPGRPSLSPTRLYRHQKEERLLVHLDGVVYKTRPKRGRPRKGVVDTLAGVLEIKTVGANMYWKIRRDGMPDSYIMQIQHAMNVTGLSWGSFCILWPDGWRMLTFDVDANPSLQQHAAEEAVKFLEEVKAGKEPSRLPPTDSRCSQCAWRSSCQGAALLEQTKGATFQHLDGSAAEEMEQMLSRYWELKSLYDEAEALYEGCKEEIKEALLLQDSVGVEVRGSRVHFKPQQSNRIDVTKVRQKYPDVAAECATVSVTRPLRVYAI